MPNEISALPNDRTSWLSAKLQLRDSSVNGKGIFAKEKIVKDERLAIFGGQICTFDEVFHLSAELRHYCLQIDDNFLLCTSKENKEPEAADYFNHSCNPNAGIVGQIILVAMRNIEVDEEITFDYATVVSEFVGVPSSIDCCCAAECCRKKITADDWKLPQLQEKYGQYFSFYLLEKINKPK